MTFIKGVHVFFRRGVPGWTFGPQSFAFYLRISYQNSRKKYLHVFEEFKKFKSLHFGNHLTSANRVGKRWKIRPWHAYITALCCQRLRPDMILASHWWKIQKILHTLFFLPDDCLRLDAIASQTERFRWRIFFYFIYKPISRTDLEIFSKIISKYYCITANRLKLSNYWLKIRKRYSF